MKLRYDPVRIAYAGRRTSILARISKAFFLSVLTIVGIIAGVPFHSVAASTSSQSGTAGSSNSTSTLGPTFGSQFPRGVGADPVPDWRLPKTVLSSVDSLISAGGVIQTSPTNITLYNLAVAMRLLGGPLPHDELLASNHRTLSSSSSWGVEATKGGTWLPLLPLSSNFTVMGTNITGSFVIRTMRVSNGPFSGILTVVYKATSAGPLKWDLEFTPSSSGDYRLTYSWWNVSSAFDPNGVSKKFRASYPSGDYTLSWGDVPAFYNSTSSMSPEGFFLSIRIGAVGAGSSVRVDPSIVSSTPLSFYNFQRKVFYEPRGGFYFVFYYNGSQNLVYRSSRDGVSWSSPKGLPGLSIKYTGGGFSPAVFSLGRNVVVASPYRLGETPAWITDYIVYWNGTVSGPDISWSSYQTIYSLHYYCRFVCGFYNVGVVANSRGQLAFSFNFENLTSISPFSCISNLYVLLGRLLLVDSTNSCGFTGSNMTPDNIRETLVPSDPLGRLRVVYQKHVLTSASWVRTLRSLRFDSISNGTVETLDLGLTDTSDFSAVSDADYGVHVVWQGASDGNVSYAYRRPSDSDWAREKYLFPGNATYPTITADYSTNDVYAFVVEGSAIAMKTKSLSQRWSDRSIVFPATKRNNPAYLGSNFVSASATNSSTIALVWLEGTPTSSYNVTFASIPIQTLWSPYAFPTDPWDGNGLAPYGQYFADLGQYVSPSAGMLTVRQTDLSVPGRGLNLEITRVYTEPQSFLNPIYNYESYPWAFLGNGWQLNFPWMTTNSQPYYVHLWDGEGYRIPLSFWNGLAATYQNYQGEHFRLARNSTGLFLFTVSGSYYVFNATNLRLLSETDPVGTNNIRFGYDISNRLSSITDAVGRVFLFCYGSNAFLSSIEQNSGSCGNSYVRRVVFTYNGPNLANVSDPAGRITSYQYNAVADQNARPWLLSRISYPTGWYTNYTYAAVSLGGQAFSYRVVAQLVATASGSPVRQYQYNYQTSGGNQVTGSTIKTYDGTQLMSYADYSFSFAGVKWTISDAGHNFVRGVQQRFGVDGEVTQDTVLVSPNRGYTNYYRYDSWGNLIYSRRPIDPSASWYHESFKSYYNDGLPPGFYAFGETFSQNNGTAANNSWFVNGGYWMVRKGGYNGTDTTDDLLSSFAWSDINRTDISLQARVYLARQLNSTADVGIFAHYPGTGTEKWALVLGNTTTARWVALQDDGNAINGGQNVTFGCPVLLGIWYTFNLTTHGPMASGWVQPDGHSPCQVRVTFNPTVVYQATGFGISSSGFSALFENVTVATVTPAITGTGFSNSFIRNGGPRASIHGVLAATAELQNGTASPPIETYYSYYPWGEPNQSRQFYNTSTAQWLTTFRTYDKYGNLIRLIDPRGNSTYYSYSSTYQYAYLTQVQTAVGTTLGLYGYNFTFGTRRWSVDPNGYNTTYQYDLLGRLRKVSYPNGLGFVSYNYNDQSSSVDIVNENGWTTRQVYDGLSRLQQVTRYSGGNPASTETYTFNWVDKMSTRTDPRARVYGYKYDALGRETMVVEPNQNTTQVFYNDLASQVLSVDEQGNTRCSVYDRLGRLASVVENSTSNCQPGIVTNYFYDETGNLVRVTNSNSQTTTYAYDNLNHLVKTSYPDRTFEAYSYDSNGNLVGKSDRKGIRTVYSYDSLNKLILTTYYGTTTTSDGYTYDRNGNLLQLSSQNASITYAYDPRNRLVGETYNVNPKYDFTISANPTSLTLSSTNYIGSSTITLTSVNGFAGNVAVTWYSINSTTGCGISLSSTSLILTPGSSATSTFTMNSSNSQCAVGTYYFTIFGTYSGIQHTISIVVQVVLQTSGGGGGGAGHHPNSPISSSMTQASASPSTTGAGYQIIYAFNGEVLNSTRYPDGLLVSYAYDGFGRVVSVYQSGTTGFYAKFAYYPDDQVKSITYGNGLTGNYTYDTQGRLLEVKLTDSNNILLRLDYSYNKTGTVATVSGQVGGVNVNEQYRYDPLQRITASVLTSTTTNTSLWYQYDSVGNRVGQGLRQGSGTWALTSYNYNITNNELKSSSGPNNISYSYDGNGNLAVQNLGTTSWTYTWDPSGRLLKAVSNGVVQGLYAYDGNGRRVESVESSTTFYAYFGTEVLYENASGVKTDYIFAGGLRVAKVTGSTVNYYHEDGLGSTRMVTDSFKNILFMDSYQPFGQDNGIQGSETYRFTGKPVSQTTGLYYDYQRWYDPSIGRFISPDSKHGHLSNPQSLNLYIYVTNDPTTATDPTGMDGCWIFSSLCNGASATWNDISGGASYLCTAAANGYNSLSPEEKQALWIGVGVVAIVATGGAAAPLVLGIGLAAGAGAVGVYAGYSYATGQQMTLSGALTAFSIGFAIGSLGAGVAVSAGVLGSDAAEATSAFTATREGVSYGLGPDAESHLTDLMGAFGTDRAGALSLVKSTVEEGADTTAFEPQPLGRLAVRSLGDVTVTSKGLTTPFVVLEPDTGTIVTAFPKTLQDILDPLGLSI